MSDGIAYSSTAAEVLAAWNDFRERAEVNRLARNEISERYDRRLMVNRAGFGHGTRVVGFEEFEDDVPGQVLGDNGELRVLKKGPPWSTVVPNSRRKAGKDLAAELATLTIEGPDLPGMPTFVLTGLRSLAPAMFEHDGAIWVMWSEDITDHAATGGGVDENLWDRQPLSAFYAAKEAHDATEQVTA